MTRVIRILTALILVLSAAAVASAETLLMPKRDGRMGASMVVWGVTTLPNGTPFTIDFGDGSPVLPGNVADRSYIAFNHTYAAQGSYTVTLTVGGDPAATVNVQIFDPALLPGGVGGDNNRALGINMAIQDGLRYLWISQANRVANFPASTTTHWGGGWSVSHAALVTLAFENHGYKLANDGSAPTGIYEKYVVRRGLNYVISGLGTINIASQGSGIAGQPVRDPCVGAGIEASPCVGLRSAYQHWPGSPETFHESYQTGVSILPLAASGALNRVNTEVAGYTNGKTYGEILQRATNALAWGQIDVNTAGRGGWYYNFNSSSSDGSTIGWDVLAILDAAAAGAMVPAWVNTEFAFALAGSLNTNGTLDYQSDGSAAALNSVGPAKNGIGLQGLFLIGETAGARVTAVTNTIDSWWNGGAGTGGNSWGGCGNQNKGCGYTMFNNFKGLKLQGITTLPSVSVPSGAGIPTSRADDDWYKDYQDWLVVNQQSPTNPGGGHWALMGFSCCDNSVPLTAAIAELILSPVALVLPDEDKFAAVGLTPPTATQIEGGTHTVTAKAEATSGAPVPGATVNFLILSGPNAGLTGTDVTDAAGEATFTYTDAGPDGTFGTDKIQAYIGTLSSNIVEMIWTPRNRAPVATDNVYTTNEDTAVAGNVMTDAVADSDADGDPLTATLVTGPSNGALVFNADGSFTYTPTANYCAPPTDSFTYKVNDGTVDSNIATVTITVNCVNDPPVANDNAHTTAEDTPVSGTATSSDVDGGAPVYSLNSVPTNGTVVFDASGAYTYTPNPNYTGTDSFTFMVSDGNGGSDIGQVDITVTPVNDAPVCSAAAPSVSLLWPPNHSLVDVNVLGVVDPVEGSDTTITITAIRQDEPTNTQGDGNTPIDGYGVGGATAQVRAERSGNPKVPGDGRMYHIFFTATDAGGATCTGVVKVGVPHDQGNGSTVIDGGPIYSSTGS